MIAEFPAGLILIAAGLALPWLPRGLRAPLALIAPALAFFQLLALAPGDRLDVDAFGFALTLVRVDRLSLAFGYVFTIAACLNAIFAWHVREGPEQPAALVYAGSALAAVFAGDLLTLFVFWEGLARRGLLRRWGLSCTRSWSSTPAPSAWR